MDFYILVIVILFLSLGVGIMILHRNTVILAHRLLALERTSRKAIKALTLGDKCEWRFLYDEFEAFGSYEDMLFGDLLKWKFEDFYPGLE